MAVSAAARPPLTCDLTLSRQAMRLNCTSLTLTETEVFEANSRLRSSEFRQPELKTLRANPARWPGESAAVASGSMACFTNSPVRFSLCFLDCAVSFWLNSNPINVNIFIRYEFKLWYQICIPHWINRSCSGEPHINDSNQLFLCVCVCACVQMCVSLFIWQGPLFSGGSGCQHHLQQDTRAGTSPKGHLPESPRRHHCCGRRRSNGHQWVPVPVPVRTLELFSAGREDSLRPGAASRSVWVPSQNGNGAMHLYIYVHSFVAVGMKLHFLE